MCLETRLIMSEDNQKSRHKTLCNLNQKHKTTSNELNEKFVKINPKKNLPKGYGHSQMINSNFSRRNSAATIDSPLSSTQAETRTPIKNTFNTRCMPSPQSRSMLNLKNLNQVCYACNDKKCNRYEFTQQRYNYECMTQQLQDQRQQQKQHRQQLWPWSPEQVVRRKVSNSRIPTCSLDKKHKQQHIKSTKLNDVIYAELLALRDFRTQNSKDCFADCRHRLSTLRSQSPSSPITKAAKTAPNLSVPGKTRGYELNRWLNNIDGKKSSHLSTSPASSSLTSLSAMPYAARQRLLRNQLAKDLPNRKSAIADFETSSALSYHSNYSY